jgi:hypothetical protein
MLEAGPGDHILLQTNSVGADRNVTVWLQGQNVYNVTNVDAWTWDNATYRLEIQTSVALAQVNIALIAGGGPGTGISFIIPAWFVDLGGDIWGIPHLFSELTKVMAAFVVFFLDSVINIVALISSIVTIVFFVGGAVIYWFASFVSFWIDLFGHIGDLFDGTTGPINIIASFNVMSWLNIIPPIATMMWYDSILDRMRKSGQPTIDILVGDIQRILFIVGTVWEWSWLIFNFVWGIASYFLSLLWNKIP